MRRLLAIAAVAAAAALAGCVGDEGSAAEQAAKQAARPTATPPPLEGPAGLDVEAVSSARDAFAEACEKREAGGGAAELSDARRAATTLLDALETNPDEAFRRSPNAPAATMRARIRALSLVARTRCGGGAATQLGERMARAAARDSS